MLASNGDILHNKLKLKKKQPNYRAYKQNKTIPGSINQSSDGRGEKRKKNRIKCAANDTFEMHPVHFYAVGGEDKARFSMNPTIKPISPAKAAKVSEKPASPFRLLRRFNISSSRCSPLFC